MVVAETAADPAKHDEIKASIRAAVIEATGTSADDVVLIGRGRMLKTSSGKLRRRETRQAYREKTLGKAAGGRWKLATTMTRLGRYRARMFAVRCRETLVGAYIAGVTMSVMLISAGVTVLLRRRTTAWRFARRMLRVC